MEVRIARVEGEVMPVNSFVVHGPTGVVIVDGQLTVPDAELPADATLCVGHGAPVGVEVLESQRACVEAFVAAVAAASDLEADPRRGQVVEAMRPSVDGDKLAFLMELSSEPVLAVLAGRRS